MGINGEFAPPTTAQKIIGPLVVAAIVALAGLGFDTWRRSDQNSRDIQRLVEFAQKGDRCTYRDCQRIESKVDDLEEDLESHDGQDAHREAHLRLQTLEQWFHTHEARSRVKSLPHPHK